MKIGKIFLKTFTLSALGFHFQLPPLALPGDYHNLIGISNLITFSSDKLQSQHEGSFTYWGELRPLQDCFDDVPSTFNSTK